MKNVVLMALCLSFLWQCKSQPLITESNNIKEIENYLKTAHKDDQYRVFLKRKLISLKNAAWMKSGQGVPMAARPIVTEIPTNNSKSNFDKALYDRLLADAKMDQRARTINLLNELFTENSAESPDAIIMVRNQSDCDMILKIEGKKSYNLAIPSKGETSIVLNKDIYTFSGSLCDVKYQSSKDVNKNIIIVLQNPGVKSEENKNLIVQNSISKDSVNQSSEKKSSSAKQKKTKNKH